MEEYPSFPPPPEAVAAFEEEPPEPEATLASERTRTLPGSVYDRIVQALVYAAVVLVPLFYLPWTAGVLEYNKQLLLLVLASVGAVVWLLGVIVSGRFSVRTSPVDKGVAGVLLASGIATVFSLTKAKSLFGMSNVLSDSFLSVATLSIFYFLALNAVRDRGRVFRNALTVSAGVALLTGLMQMFTWYILPGALTHTRAFHLVGSLNTLGILAAIALPLFAKTTSYAFGKAAPWIAGAGTLLSLVVLAILNWWVLWAVALAGMLAMIAFDSLNLTRLAEDYGRRRGFALSRFVIPMAVIVLGAFLLLVHFNPASLKSNFPTEIAPPQGLSWNIARGVMSQRLLVGYGPENFSLAFDRFGAGALANSQFASVKFYDATSQFFTSLVQGGVVAILGFVFLLWCLVQVVARFGSTISESVARGEHAGLATQSSGTLAALVALTVAFFLYPFNFTLAFVWYALLVLAALIVAGDRQRTVDIEERPFWSLSASLGFIVVLILVLTAVYFTSVRYLADAQYAKALQAENADASLQSFGNAINLNGSNDRYFRDASQVALQSLSDELGASGPATAERTQRIQNLMASAVQLAQRATDIAPEESLNWANLARVYQALTGLVQDVEQLADQSFQKASDLRPGDPTFDNEDGQMWLARADLVQQARRSGDTQQLRDQYSQSLDNAEAAFKRALDKSGTFGLAIYNLGAVYDRKNQVPDAISQLEKLVPANPNEPILMFELGLLYARNGDVDNALTAMRRAVLLAPQYANARWYLALLLEEKKDIPGALDQLHEIEKTNPDNETLQQKISQLEAVPPVTAGGEAIDTEPLQ